MAENTGKAHHPQSFRSQLESLLQTHEEEVKALKDKILSLEQELRNKAGQVEPPLSLAQKAQQVVRKGQQVRLRVKAFAEGRDEKKPSPQEWDALTAMYEIIHRDFIFALLARSSGQLTGRQFYVSVLVRDGWDEYQLQHLLGVSSERISDIFRKINRILFGHDTSKHFAQHIKAMDTSRRDYRLPPWLQ